MTTGATTDARFDRLEQQLAERDANFARLIRQLTEEYSTKLAGYSAKLDERLTTFEKRICSMENELAQLKDGYSDDMALLASRESALSRELVRFRRFDERITNLETDRSYSQVAPEGYKPQSWGSTPTGRAFSEPLETWGPDHPYRR
jgi:uncharacterized coiled-coil protein SlyX